MSLHALDEREAADHRQAADAENDGDAEDPKEQPLEDPEKPEAADEQNALHSAHGA